MELAISYSRVPLRDHHVSIFRLHSYRPFQELHASILKYLTRLDHPAPRGYTKGCPVLGGGPGRAVAAVFGDAQAVAFLANILGGTIDVLAYSAALAVVSGTALAGPPYVSDDPEPTDYQHYEIYLFTNGMNARDGTGGASGIDFNYGAAPDLQLTAALPIAYESPTAGSTVANLGNVELAAKYRFLHQAEIGWDVAVFPRVFLPSASARVGETHASLLLPLWLEKDWGSWSTFGGGGCVINRGGDSQDFCQAGWALTRQVLPNLQLGAEIVHQTADKKGGRASTGIGVGLRYDINENLHLLGYAGPGVQNAAQTARYSWYGSVLFTF